MVKTAVNRSESIKLKTPALVAASGLILMAIIAPIVNFGILERFIGYSDAAILDQNIVNVSTLFWIAASGFTIVAILDTVVALALYRFFKPASNRIAFIAAAARILYAGGVLVAVLQLVNGTALNVSGSGQQTFFIQEQALMFTSFWTAVLALFGLHLILLGWLAIKAYYAPNWLGAGLIVAGIGYAVDGLSSVFITNYATDLAQYVFFGEVLLIVWIIVQGRKVTLPATP